MRRAKCRQCECNHVRLSPSVTGWPDVPALARLSRLCVILRVVAGSAATPVRVSSMHASVVFVCEHAG
eukprot:6182942-Pleurochrysis_carterae.AAC.2